MLVPTKRFWGLVALGLPVAAVSFQQGSLQLFWAFNVSIVIVAWITSRLAPSIDGLLVRRRFDAVLSVRASNRIELDIINEGADRLIFLMRDETPPAFATTEREFAIDVQPGATVTRHYYATPPQRGAEFFRGTFIRLACPLGLVTKQVRLNTEQPVRVYPNVLALREFNLLQQQGRLRELGIRKTRIRGLGTEFESLREYADGDDYRKIDWKASARRDKLIVRQYETERNQSVIIAVDVGRHMLGEINGVTKLDHALDSCLMLTQAAAAAGDQVGLLVYSDQVERYIPPRKGRNQLGMIIEALHDLVALPVESDTIRGFAYLATRWKRRALLVNFTDSGDADRARALGKALGPLSRRHLVLMARISDPRLREVMDSPVVNPQTLYRKAAGLLIEEDRRQATSIFNSLGLHNLESEPQDLAASLVSFYFHAKEHALI